MARRQLPNRWYTEGPVDRAPMRLQRALRSRPKRDQEHDESTGTARQLRTYFESEAQLGKHLQRLQKQGIDVRAHLLSLGSVHVRASTGGRWRQYDAPGAMRLAFGDLDTLPPHRRDP